MFFQGQRVYNARFKLSLQNIDDLEDRIRAAEAKLGIAAGEGLPIKYERSTETIAGLFGTFLLLVMLGMLFIGGRNLRSRFDNFWKKMEGVKLFKNQIVRK